MIQALNIDAVMADRDAWKREAEMYQRAWTRELAEFDGTIRRKSHLIDALVLTTQELVAKARERAVGLPDAVTAWRTAEQERCDATRACADRVRACREAGVIPECNLETKRVLDAEQALRDAAQAMSVFFGCQPAKDPNAAVGGNGNHG